ncbi:MAG: GNAT family N-acetyltransferase [Casimicrobiaceae bacterium]
MNRLPAEEFFGEDVATRIEEASLNALQTQSQVFYDGWLLRLSPGSAKRARSVSAHFGSTLALEHKIAYCERLYARRALPMLFRITPFVRPADLEKVLIARGYVVFDNTLVQVMALDRPPDLPPLPDNVQVRTVDAASFAEIAALLRGSDTVQRDAHLERLAHSPLESRFVVVEADGERVATAQLAADDDVAGLFDVITAEHARGRGYATAAVGRLLVWAWEHAMRIAYLQVTATNMPAVAIYRRFGFASLYSYHYCARPHEVEHRMHP